MYYLRTKSAVDAIKFTLDNAKKAASVPEMATTTMAEAKDPASIEVEPMSPEALREIIAKSRESDEEDCLMCGS